jgi:serine/threonine protein kinase
MATSTGSNNTNEQNDATIAWNEKTKPIDHTPPESQPGQNNKSVKKTLKGRFILDTVIAKGGMGIVYKARDLRKIEAMDDDPYVAIKLLKPGNCSIKKDFIHLQRETRKTQMLSHPNIVNVHDFDRDGDIFMMTMEYLQGEALSEKLGKDKAHLPRKEALHIIKSIGQALIYAHSKNIIHCDLKPANIFLTTDNIIKVLDFGIARAFQVNKMLAVNETLNHGSQLALTPTYASCEMLAGKTPEPRDDVYALACIAYELLTGKHPFNRKTCTQANEQGLLPVPIEGLSRNQWKALSRGLSAKREDRPDSIRTFIQDIVPTRQKGRYRIWALPLISSLLLLSLFLLLPRQDPAGNDQPITPVVPFETLSQNKQEEILALLEIADAHMMVQRYTDPPGSNAYIAYQKILELHPSNPHALSGLDRIADAYANLAKGYNKNGNHQMAKGLIKEGLGIRPGHEALLKLQERLK